jgi:hypothetical protein
MFTLGMLYVHCHMWLQSSSLEHFSVRQVVPTPYKLRPFPLAVTFISILLKGAHNTFAHANYHGN